MNWILYVRFVWKLGRLCWAERKTLVGELYNATLPEFRNRAERRHGATHVRVLSMHYTALYKLLDELEKGMPR